MYQLTNKQSTSKSFFKHSILVPVLALGLVSFNASANEFDPRQAIDLNEEHKAQLLSNMRGALAVTQSIVKALAEDDMQAVADYARPMGFKVRRQKPKDGLHDALPRSFKMQGKAMHQNFDKIADDAETLKDPKHTLQQLAEVMNNCQGCHATFRIESIDSVDSVDSVDSEAIESEKSFFQKLFMME